MAQALRRCHLVIQSQKEMAEIMELNESYVWRNTQKKKWEKPWEMPVFRWWGKKADRAGPVWWNKLVLDREFEGGHGTQKALHKPSWTKEWMEFYKGMKVIKVKRYRAVQKTGKLKRKGIWGQRYRGSRGYFSTQTRGLGEDMAEVHWGSTSQYQGEKRSWGAGDTKTGAYLMAHKQLPWVQFLFS